MFTEHDTVTSVHTLLTPNFLTYEVLEEDKQQAHGYKNIIKFSYWECFTC